MSSKLLQLLEYEGPELASAFQRASIQGRGTPQEVADFRENAFRSVIGRYFPFPHRCTKGNIFDVSGTESASIDCVIINPAHPYTIDTHKKFSVILADGVDVAIEVKPDVAATHELHRALKQVESVKRLWRQRTPILSPTAKRTPRHILDHSRKIPCFVFTLHAKADPIDTGKEIQSYYETNGIPPEHQVDFVVINQLGILCNYRYPEISRVSDTTSGETVTGLFFEEWGTATFAAFILRLNDVYHATARITSPLLPRYLGDLHANRIERVQIQN